MKVCKELQTVDYRADKSFQEIVKKCLKKKLWERPEVKDLILMDEFQEKCREHRITLPLHLNKSK